MADREVRATRKNNSGDILALCNGTESWWSPRGKWDAIKDIDDEVHTYFVNWSADKLTEIRVVNGENGKYLRTDRDNTKRNNLDDLPDC